MRLEPRSAEGGGSRGVRVACAVSTVASTATSTVAVPLVSVPAASASVQAPIGEFSFSSAWGSAGAGVVSALFSDSVRKHPSSLCRRP